MLSNDPPSTLSETPVTPEPYLLHIAGFWQRILADVIDLVVLGVIFFVLSLVLRSYLFSIGPSGRILSFMIAVAYFTYFTRYQEGKTPGKQFVKLAVTDAQGRTLTFKKSLLRSAILCAVLALNGANLSIFFTSGLGSLIGGWIVIGGILGLFYGYIFNRVTRQGPHDLLTGSYVVYEFYLPDAYSNYLAPTHRKVHEIVPVCLALFGAIATIIGSTLNPTADLYKTLNQDRPDDVFRVEVGRTGDTLTILAWAKDECEKAECDPILTPILWNTLQQYEDLEEIETLELGIINRIDLGFGLVIDIRPLFYRIVWLRSASPQEWLSLFRVVPNQEGGLPIQ
jgi:uncharacterized RDD family membrane protein YckC